MVLEHEIPRGSKLHFGTSARIKRCIENLAVELFYKNDFEEIITPSFVYQSHQKSFFERDIIKLSTQDNHQIALRHDSTIDIIRIITKRLDRSTENKKWFYIQPVFSYPTLEVNQIGAECLDSLNPKHSLKQMLDISIEFFKRLKIEPILQITNAKITHLCAKEFNIDIEHFKNFKLDILQKNDFIKSLLRVNNKTCLKLAIKDAPSFIKSELQSLEDMSYKIDYSNLIISPILLTPVEYYNDMFFRAFIDNRTLLGGGNYSLDGIKGCGFGIYTDNIINHLLKYKIKFEGCKW